MTIPTLPHSSAWVEYIAGRGVPIAPNPALRAPINVQSAHNLNQNFFMGKRTYFIVHVNITK